MTYARWWRRYRFWYSAAPDDKSTGVLPPKTYDASSLHIDRDALDDSYHSPLRYFSPRYHSVLRNEKTNGDQNWRCLNLHHGININDRFMELIERCMQDPDVTIGGISLTPTLERFVILVGKRMVAKNFRNAYGDR